MERNNGDGERTGKDGKWTGKGRGMGTKETKGVLEKDETEKERRMGEQ